jgi:peptide/nickel transport system substrate-binding protein
VDEENDAVKVTSASDTTPNYAALHANGTGPFKLASHEAGVKTVYEKNDGWWDRRSTISTPSNSPRSAPTPPALRRFCPARWTWFIRSRSRTSNASTTSDGTVALTGPELRTIFLGMDQMRDELLYSDVKGKNPFKDDAVRKAFYQAIDIEAIKQKVMRDLATPSAIMISPFLFSKSGEFERYPYDPEAAKALLAEAGYPRRFLVGMDCPNDRYVNDEAICQAVAAMLARVGVKVDLNAQPKAKYFAKILASGGYDTSFYLLGWTPGSFDSWNVLDNLMNCRDEAGKGSPFNLGGFCDAKDRRADRADPGGDRSRQAGRS